MKNVFKIVLLLITIICYASNVTEWDDNESEKNYQNECHLYLLTEQTTFDSAISYSIPSEIIIEYSEIPKNVIVYAANNTLFFTNSLLKKPEKIFLRNRALLI